MDRQHTILLPNSHWATNVGNAFFSLGVNYVLQQAAVNSRIIQTAQLSTINVLSFKNLVRKNDLEYIKYSEPDWFMLCGPLFVEYVLKAYDRVLEKIFENNSKTKLIIMNAGSVLYDKNEYELSKRFLEKYHPTVLISRDTETYERYGKFADFSYCGFDTAFFCPDYYKPFDVPKLQEYVTFCFDRGYEPRIDLNGFDKNYPATYPNVKIHNPKIFKKHYRLWKYLNILHRFPREIEGKLVIRPNQEVLRESDLIIFWKPNAFISQTPYAYLNLYSDTNLTVADKVHACVATLAFGNPARLISRTKRRYLFKRLGAETIDQEIVKLDLDNLEKEKRNYLDFVKKVYKEIVG
ncbi:polysaccharide pyruvyl transferase family protein [Myxococcota bacterium]